MLDSQLQEDIINENISRAKAHCESKGVNPKIELCPFVAASDLIPKDVACDFWALISQDAPFSWGDNNRSMVKASDFLQHCQSCMDIIDDPESQKQFEDILIEVSKLGEIYIDLEN